MELQRNIYATSGSQNKQNAPLKIKLTTSLEYLIALKNDPQNFQLQKEFLKLTHRNSALELFKSEIRIPQQQQSRLIEHFNADAKKIVDSTQLRPRLKEMDRPDKGDAIKKVHQEIIQNKEAIMQTIASKLATCNEELAKLEGNTAQISTAPSGVEPKKLPANRIKPKQTPAQIALARAKSNLANLTKLLATLRDGVEFDEATIQTINNGIFSFGAELMETINAREKVDTVPAVKQGIIEQRIAQFKQRMDKTETLEFTRGKNPLKYNAVDESRRYFESALAYRQLDLMSTDKSESSNKMESYLKKTIENLMQFKGDDSFQAAARCFHELTSGKEDFQVPENMAHAGLLKQFVPYFKKESQISSHLEKSFGAQGLTRIHDYLKIAFLSVIASQDDGYKIDKLTKNKVYDTYMNSALFINRGKDTTNVKKINSSNLGILRNYHNRSPSPTNRFNVAGTITDRPVDRFTFDRTNGAESQPGWLSDKKNGVGDHPFVNSISGTILAVIRVLEGESQQSFKLEAKHIDTLKNMIATLLLVEGGHSLHEFSSALQEHLTQSGMDSTPLNLENLFFNQEQDSPFQQALNDTLRKNSDNYFAVNSVIDNNLEKLQQIMFTEAQQP